MNKILIGTSLIVSTLLSACSSSLQSKSTMKSIGMANPASVYCEKIGGSSITKKDASENEVGYCKLPDGTVLDEWELYRSAHQDNQKNLIISYDMTKKQNIIDATQKQKMEIIYDLKNMNIIVVSVPEINLSETIKEIEKIDGVLGVQEDSKMELN